MPWLARACLVIVAFLLGAIPTGVVLARRRGVDLRAVGSGNIGATNAARALGRSAGVLVFALDALKAALPVIVARAWLGLTAEPWLIALVAAAAVLGHVYSPYLGGRGGKGVACAFGAFAALDLRTALLALLVYASAWALTRIGGVASLAATAALVLWSTTTPMLLAYRVLALGLGLLILWRHRDNLRALRQGRVRGP
jgi:glycerol-3-phosphate acyltransferase PlsY